MNKNPEDIDFSQYMPNWKSDSSDDNKEEGWYFDEGFENIIKDPDQIIDEENEIKWKHVVKAAQILKEKNNNSSGPYLHEQLVDAVSNVIIQEALDELIEKRLIKQNDDGTFQLTKQGDEIANKLNKKNKQD